jgi:hypothetical protein
LETGANQRRRSDDEDADHAATESFPPTGIPSLTVTRRTFE